MVGQPDEQGYREWLNEYIERYTIPPNELLISEESEDNMSDDTEQISELEQHTRALEDAMRMTGEQAGGAPNIGGTPDIAGTVDVVADEELYKAGVQGTVLPPEPPVTLRWTMATNAKLKEVAPYKLTDRDKAQRELIKDGSVVKIIGTSMGCGASNGEVVKGDIGIVKQVMYDNSYIVAIAGKASEWCAKIQDIEIINGVTGEIDELVEGLAVGYSELHRQHPAEKFNPRIQSLNSEINTTQENLTKLYHTLRDLNKLKECDVRRVRGISSNAQIREYFKHLLGNCYENIRVSNHGLELKGLTKPIVIRAYHHNFQLGKFIVTVDFDGITIRNEVESAGRDGYIHPHISDGSRAESGIRSAGNVCWGSYNNSFIAYLERYDYLRVLDLVHTFLSNVTLTSQYIDIRYWYPDADTRCARCWHIADECHCADCRHCGENEDSCECTTCPNTGNILPDGVGEDMCEDCDNWNSDENSCNY